MAIDICSYVKLEDFPTNFRDVVEVVGIEKAIELSEQFGGTTQYIPKLDDIRRVLRNAKIRQEFNGANIQELARKYELTDVRIRSIVAVKQNTIEKYLEEEDGF